MFAPNAAPFVVSLSNHSREANGRVARRSWLAHCVDHALARLRVASHARGSPLEYVLDPLLRHLDAHGAAAEPAP